MQTLTLVQRHRNIGCVKCAADLRLIWFLYIFFLRNKNKHVVCCCAHLFVFRAIHLMKNMTEHEPAPSDWYQFLSCVCPAFVCQAEKRKKCKNVSVRYAVMGTELIWKLSWVSHPNMEGEELTELSLSFGVEMKVICWANIRELMLVEILCCQEIYNQTSFVNLYFNSFLHRNKPRLWYLLSRNHLTILTLTFRCVVCTSSKIDDRIISKSTMSTPIACDY